MKQKCLLFFSNNKYVYWANEEIAVFFLRKGLYFINIGKELVQPSPIKGHPTRKENYSQILWRSTHGLRRRRLRLLQANPSPPPAIKEDTR
jgi:hypothetical protein